MLRNPRLAEPQELSDGVDAPGLLEEFGQDHQANTGRATALSISAQQEALL